MFSIFFGKTFIWLICGMLCAFVVGVDSGAWVFMCHFLEKHPVGFSFMPLGWRKSHGNIVIITYIVSVILCSMNGAILITNLFGKVIGLAVFVIFLIAQWRLSSSVGLRKARAATFEYDKGLV
jgi:hypothetical protein